MSENLESISATLTAQEVHPEPMEEGYSSLAQDTPASSSDQNTSPLSSLEGAVNDQSSRRDSEPHQMNLPRSQMTPSPVLGLLQPGGTPAMAKSPAASSTHSSLCSVEESSLGLAPSLHFLREAHNYLGRYTVLCMACAATLIL